jgi:hypothetical protein
MPYESFQVGIVVEESPPVSQWAETTYVPVAVLPGAPDAAPWADLGPGLRGRRFFAGVATVEMFSGDAGLLRDNLLVEEPQIWVVLRPTAAIPPCELVMATVDPTMGEAAQGNPGDIAVALPMPPEIFARVADFVERRYVEQPFSKRRRDEYREDGGAEPLSEARGRRR